MTTKLPSLDKVDQKTLQDLAKKCTAPRPGLRYRDPSEVKDLYAKAKQNWVGARLEDGTQSQTEGPRRLEECSQRTCCRWTLAELQKPQETLVVTNGPSTMLRQLKRPNRSPSDGRSNISVLFFQKTEPRDPPRWNKDIDTGNHFTIEDLRQALHKGKTSKAVGEDLVSFELISALCEDSATEQALLNWMERLRCGEALPREWLRTVVTLLPKSDKPRGPKDLPADQCRGLSGQGLRDHVTQITCMQPSSRFSLDTEWHLGLSWCRIDIQKAFDTLARGQNTAAAAR